MDLPPFLKNANYSMLSAPLYRRRFVHLKQINVQMIIKEFGKVVQKLRKERGITQEELSFRAGLHRTYIGMIDRGEKNITLANIEKVANALNVSLKELFDGL